MSNPLDQFKLGTFIKIPFLFNKNIDYTNSSFFMFVAVFLVILFFFIAIRKIAIIPKKMQALAEILRDFIMDALVSNTGDRGKKYFPHIFTFFLYILSCNLLGLMPFGFTVTSHISNTLTLSVLAISLVTFAGINENGMQFFRTFLPHGIPMWLAPLIIVIEVVSYLFKPLSLSLRLAINMIAGHIMLEVIASFLENINIVLSPFPLLMLVLLIIFEVFVSVLQAYLFTKLTCVYLGSVLESH